MMIHFKNSLITCGITAIGLLGSVVNTMAQSKYDPSQFVKVEINSGDPAFPYPQFLEYKGGKSLAKYNAEGVTHADMEKAGREAYEIMTHRCRYFGGTHCGVKYIVFNPISDGGTTETSLTYPDVPGAYGTFCSEGDGYMLLAAALFADQKTYNGLYMWIHDNRFSGVKRFKDGKMFRENKKGFTTCPYLAGWGADETTTTEGKCHSATDGDVDIAMATLIAYKQWGEFMKQDGEIVKDANGDTISYLYEAQRCIGALVDTVPQWEYGANTLAGYLPGVIGIDGYTKDGVAQGEVTRWRFSDAALARYGNINGPYNGGPVLMSQYGKMFADYDAPSYYDEFYKWFKEDGAKEYDEKITAWRVHQFQKAAASGNWITKKAYEAGKYASIGNFSVGDDGSNPTFGESGLDGEDFRFAWRHLLDYLWHGETAYDWDPKNHSVIEGQSHDGVKLMGLRHAELLKDPPGVGDKPGTSACSKLGASPDAGQPMWSGVVHNPQQYNSDGTVKSFYHTNYSIGAGSPAAVIAEDLEFLNDLYRSLELRWDGNNTDVGPEDEERYIGSTPKYFHGWYRTLGMLVCQGNMHAPADMKPAANMKVYMSVDKTYAYVDDAIDYTVQYRNYGTLEATGVKIETEIDSNYEVVSISNGGKFSNGKIVWNIGSVPGFKTGHLKETIDSVSFRVIAKDTLNPRICLTSTISGSNFPDWTSNEFPNHATYTMERNCVDILANRTLTIDKKASRKAMNPGDVVAFTVEFENKSEGESSWLNGGRDNVRLSYGNYMMSNTANLFYQYYRFWNDAYEAYIDLGNYRVSYFMYDAASIGLYDENENPTGWQFELDNGPDMAKYGWMPTGAETKFTYQKMPNGEDEHGKWNQRIMIQFPSSLMAASAYVYDHLNNAFQLHKGGYGPCFFRTRLGIKQAKAMYEKVKDDWSYSGDLAISALDGQAETYTLITPGWANYDNPGYEITNYARNICNPKSVGNYDRVLIEEFDGYTWRRIQGTGPLPGREANNVTIVDTIPYELEWVGWKDSTALKNDKGEKIKATYTPAADPKAAGYTGIVKWTTPVMLVGEKDKLIYLCKARDLGCPTAEDAYYMNVAWISSQTDSPDSALVNLMTTCAEIPPVIDEQTCLYKFANVKNAMSGDNISYKVKFINNVGTKVDADCKKTTDWVALNKKSIPDVNSKGLVLSKEGGAFAAPTYSYGKDGEFFATIEDASNTESIFLVMRYVSGTPGAADFKGVAIKMKVNLDQANNFGYELYNDGKLIAAEGTNWQDVMQFKGSSKAPTFKFVLRGDKLYMYCNDEDDEWENVMKDWSGLTSAGPGYFGVYTGRNNGSPTLSRFETSLDYAFNINIGDYIPKELEDVTSISNKGTFNASSNTIQWPTVAEKVEDGLPWGDSLVYTFDATVNDCSKFINNYAYATVLGQDSMKALNTIECGETNVCPLTKASLKSDDVVFCETDSMRIKATVKDKGSYLYQWYDGKTKIGTETTDLDTLWVRESGEYWVHVTSADDATCTVNSDTLKMGVDQLPVLVLNDTSACAGGEIELPSVAATDNGTYKYEWSDGSTGATLTVNKEGEYSVIVTNGACVAKDTAKVAFGSVTLKGGVFTLNGIEYDRAVTDTGSVCPDSKVKLSVNYAADGNVFEWSSKPAGAIADNSTGNEIVIYPTETTTYYVRFKQECEAVDSFVVTIGGVKLSGGSFTLNGTEYPRSEGNTGTVCPGADNKLTVSYKSDDGVYAWSSKPADAALVSAGATTTISPKETTTYYVDFTLGCAARDSFVVEIGEPMKVEIVAEVGCNVTKLTASTTGSANAEFTWTKDGAEIKTNPLEIDGANNHFGTVSVVATAPDACPSEPVETTYLNIEPHVMIDGSATVCPGKTATLAAVITYPKEDFVPGIKPVDEPKSNTYSWSDGTSVVGTEATLEAPAGTYTLTVSDGLCEMTATHTIEEGTGEVKGDLTINGTKIVGSGAERTYGTCGGELEIVADYVHDAGTGFTWTVNGVEQPETGNTITLTPTGATTVKIAFQNECDAFDEFTITQIDSVRLTTAVTRLCGTTQLSAASETDGVDYVWTNAAGDVLGLGKNLDMKASANGAVSGVAYVQGTAAGYCDSRKVEVAYAIDTLGVTLTGPESVCEGSTAELAATATASDPSAAIEYSYAFRKAGSGVFMPLGMPSVPTTTTPELAESTEIEVTATAGQCEAKATFTVKVAGSKRDGVLTINGAGIGAKDASGTKFYRTCGDHGDMELSVTHTGDDFVWTKDGEPFGEGRSVTITPTTTETHTEQYIVNYSNLCAASDTINIEVHPISAAADWAEFTGVYCEGDSARAELIVTNYDATEPGSYIKWYKDNEEQPQLAGRTSLEFNGLKAEQSGVYRYEVSNGICTRPTSPDAGSLVIRPRVTVGVLSDTLVVPRADTAELQVITVPEDAVVQWFEETGEGRKGLNVGNPYRMTITRDYQLTAVVLASGYCSDSVDMTVLADAHLSLNLVHSTPGVCKDGGLDTLSIDTSGTGKIYFPEKYVISIQAGTDSVHFSEVARNVTEYVAEVTEPTYFRAVINYGKHQAVSKVLKVRVYDDATFDVVYDRKVCVDGKSEIAIRNLSPKDAGIVWLPDPSLEAKDSSAVATPPANHTYGFYIVQNNWRCQQKVTFEIETVPQLELELTDTTICQGGSANLRAQVFNGTAEGYRWYDSDGQLIAERSVQTVKPEETSTYTLKTTNGYCDSTSAEVTVTVAESPVITDIENMGKRETRVSVEGGLPPYEYAVYPHDYGSSEIVAVDRYGVNTYKVRDLNGCVATRLDTLEAPTIEIPVLVTPNNDGVKDLFEVPALTEAYPDSRIKIFDRWGKVLAEFKASDGGWDGTYNGKKMRADDYWYEIYIPELYKYYTGHFTLNNE